MNLSSSEFSWTVLRQGENASGISGSKQGRRYRRYKTICFLLKFLSVGNGHTWERSPVTGATGKAEPSEVSEETWVLELEDIEKVSSRLLNRVRYGVRPFKSTKNRFYKGDILYGKLRPYLDKVVLADEDGVCSSEIMPIRGFVGLAPQFIRLVLKSPYFVQYANSSTHGMNLPRLGTDKARQALFPLPPEVEQHRIVTKVDELMGLIDRLEQSSCRHQERNPEKSSQSLGQDA